MARIIYGVAGEGFGHSSRSHLIGRRLLDAGHDVMFVGSRKSLTYLRQYFGERVREIFGLSFTFQDGRIDKSETFKRNLMRWPEGNRTNDELFKRYFEPFDPELVISDFEPFSAWWAWRKGVPFISVDHEHVLTLCELEHAGESWFSRITAQAITEFYYVGAVAYVIVNFFDAPVRVDSAVMAPPVIRPLVAAMEPSAGEHITVYSTTADRREHVIDTFSNFPKTRFHIYGFDEDAQVGNCIFRKRSTEGFLNDLASCRGVVASAGFSLISECLHLRKKLLLLPLEGQYEQALNAHYAEKLGLGVSSRQLDIPSLEKFFSILDAPLPTDKRILWPDNARFFEALQTVFDRLEKPISIATQ